jgi:hypothetical protein
LPFITLPHAGAPERSVLGVSALACAEPSQIIAASSLWVFLIVSS